MAGSVSVLDFGAKGDGTTDDTSALQTALNSAPWGTLLVPKGVYRTGSLNITENSEVVFAEGALLSLFTGQYGLSLASSVRLTNCSIVESRSYASIPNLSVGLRLNAASDVWVMGGYIDGFTAANIRIEDACDHLAFRAIRIRNADDKSVNVGRGISLLQAGMHTDISIIGCMIEQNGHHGIQVLDSSNFGNVIVRRLLVEACHFFDNGDNGVDLIGVEDYSIVGNVCIQNGDNGLGTSGQGIHVGQVANRRTITGNVCNESVLGFGIEVVGSHDVVVAGNQCSDNDFAGITLRTQVPHDLFRISCMGNVCTSNQDGIRVDGTPGKEAKHVSVVGNTCVSNNERGINVNEGKYVSVATNTVMNNGQGGNSLDEGIICQYGSDNSVVGNIASDDQTLPTQSYGVRLHNETDSAYHGNECKGNSALQVAATASSTGARSARVRSSGSCGTGISCSMSCGGRGATT